MSVALALSTALIAAPSPDPLTGPELVAALSEGWWCTWEPSLEGCSEISRYDFDALTVSGCGGSDIWWIETALVHGERSGLDSVAEVEPLLIALLAQAEAMGAEQIKFCQTRAFKIQDDVLCSVSWELGGKPRMRLSRSGAWHDPEDYVVSGSDSERYWRMWPAMFAEIAAQTPESERSAEEAKAVSDPDALSLNCHSFEREGDRLRMTSRDQTWELRPLARPEDGVIVPWQPNVD